MKAIIGTWKTLTDSLSVVGRYSNYYLYPLLSYVVMLLVTFTAVIPSLGGVLGSGQKDALTRIVFFLAVYLAYGVLYFVIVFCNVALVTSVAARLDGGDPPLIVGVSQPFHRIGPIISYTLVSATLGLLSFLARVLINPLFGMVIAPAIGKRLWTRWHQLSYSIPLLMAVPVIALDHPAPHNIFKRGELLVKETWGERVKPAHGIGLLALLVLLPIILLIATPTLQRGSTEHNADLIWLGSSVLLVSILTFTQVNALVDAIFALAAYRYATVRKTDLFPGDQSYAEGAFVKSKKETGQSDTLPVSPSDSASVITNDSSN